MYHNCMSEHNIVLSLAGEQLAQERPIAKLVAKIWNDEEYYPAAYLRERQPESESETVTNELLASSFFTNMNPIDQSLVHKAFGLIGDTDEVLPSWAIEGDYSADTLFKSKDIVRRPLADPADGFLLAGAAALDVERIKPGFLDRATEFGFRTKLEFAMFIGASVLASKLRPFNYLTDAMIDGSSVRSEQTAGVTRVTTVGADLHGDFRLEQHEEYDDGALSPFGTPTKFAPTGHIIAARAYHHTEMEVLQTCLEHVHDVATPDEKQAFITQTSEALQSALSIERTIPVIRYGDFGAINAASYSLELAAYIKLHDSAEPFWGRKQRAYLPSGPGYDADLCIYSSEGVLHLINTEDPLAEAPTLQLSLRELPGFIAALVDQANQANGRTDAASLLGLISTYQALG